MPTVSLSDACARGFCFLLTFSSVTCAKAAKFTVRTEPHLSTKPARSVTGRERSCSLQVRPLPCEQGLAKGDLSFPEAGLHPVVAAAQVQLQRPPDKTAHRQGR